MDDRRRPWLEGVGLLVVLAIAAAAFLVAKHPGGSDQQSVSTPTSPSAAASSPVPSPDVTAPPVKKAAKGSKARGGKARTTDPGIDVKADGEQCVNRSRTQLSVTSFNIHSGFNPPRTRQMLPTLAAEMKAMKSDVFLLEEVDQNRIWSGRVNQPEYFANALGMEYAFATNVLRPGNSRYGTAILSRYPILESHNYLLPRPGNTQQRGLLRVVIEPVPGRKVSLYVTHLEATSYAARVAQARVVAARIASDPNPVVLGGDMNSRSSSTTMALLRQRLVDTWSAAGRGNGLTHPNARPNARIDYVFASPSLGTTLTQVVPGTVSDHRAVRSVLDLAPDVPAQVCLPVLTDQ
ncbi:endonuclease/exonuclease/phosphatase family protein [Nocardioides acrostichi]|uniref:Endonuclease/exonuclease/phosphatase family protein n=1 Tax=Nocardioides acrostichi TaxID=2784339 RepID=A0A930UW09_9ACTN|nr:endonuclease/exonuclease/phosphatase family protein [Nocardioides acrostichi]MBF4161893.1 endonuclease/exonuclease/phosphatase family protein [Nocardioides acrostichi]